MRLGLTAPRRMRIKQMDPRDLHRPAPAAFALLFHSLQSSCRDSSSRDAPIKRRHDNHSSIDHRTVTNCNCGVNPQLKVLGWKIAQVVENSSKISINYSYTCQINQFLASNTVVFSKKSCRNYISCNHLQKKFFKNLVSWG